MEPRSTSNGPAAFTDSRHVNPGAGRAKHPRAARRGPQPVLAGVAAAALLAGLAGCEEGGRAPGPTATSPAQPTTAAAPTTGLATTRPAELQPATAPATTTTSRPADDLDRIRVIIRSLNDPQDGWLVVEEIDEKARRAVAIGEVQDRRKIIVDTENIVQLRVELRRIRLSPRGRLVLRLDGQGIELHRTIGPKVRFRRARTGEWNRVRE